MRRPHFLPKLRPLTASCLLAFSLAAMASEHGDAHAAPAAAEARPASAAAAPASAAAPRARATAAPIDPLERVRERLAEKLGATPPEPKENPNLLRVASKAASEPVAPPAASRPRPPRPASSHAAAAAATAALLPKAHDTHWDYQGSGGPEHWAELRPDFAQCASGSRQSPIDIRDGIRVELEPVAFDYRPSGFRVIDNGHTVQVNVAPGNFIEVQGRRFELVQFHFHRPSEERIDGRQFDMVAHLVHKDLDGRLAVVAVLLERGSAQPLVQAVWNNLPLEKGDEVAARTAIDLSQLLPSDRRYYTYMGSLTTPPCSEGVLWMVMKSPVQLSVEQIGIFTRLYPMNARPIQPAGGRLIKQSN